MKNLIWKLRVLITPACWAQVHPFMEAWDKKLSSMLDLGMPIHPIDRFTAKIGDFTVWIENHPYASFTIQGSHVEVRPRRSTILRAWSRLEIDPESQKESELKELERSLQ